MTEIVQYPKMKLELEIADVNFILESNMAVRFSAKARGGARK
jgi:hypothetical protein